MSERYRYVLVGGGVASVTAAMGIRERDAEGSIAIVRDEPTVPYDRPPLSKGFLRNPEVGLDDISSKFDHFYPENRIDLHTGVRATRLDRNEKKLHLEEGRALGYEKLLLATGTRALRLEIPGADHPKAHVLRTMADAEAIRQNLATSESLVIVGSGYNALEVAGTALKLGKQVTILTKDAHPWGQFVSSATGGFLRSYFEALGVVFRFETTVTAFSDVDGKVQVIAGEEAFACDLVLMAVGVVPNVELAVEAGLAAGPTGIQVNEFLATADPDVYAVGDVACLYDPALGVTWRAEHHLHAKWTGQCAGRNLAGAAEPYDRVAYFWSDFHDHHMILRGFPGPSAMVKAFGDVAAGTFVELYADQTGRVRMGLALNADEPKLDPISDQIEALIRAQTLLDQVDPKVFAP